MDDDDKSAPALANLLSELAVNGLGAAVGSAGGATAASVDLNNRQLHPLQQMAANKYIQDHNLTGEDAQNVIAAACFLAQCANVSEGDPQLGYLQKLQDTGAGLTDLQVALTSMSITVQVAASTITGVDGYSFDIPAHSETYPNVFDKTTVNALVDAVSRNEQIGRLVAGTGDAVGGGMLMSGGGALCTTVVGCLLGGPLIVAGGGLAFYGGYQIGGSGNLQTGAEVQASLTGALTGQIFNGGDAGSRALSAYLGAGNLVLAGAGPALDALNAVKSGGAAADTALAADAGSATAAAGAPSTTPATVAAAVDGSAPVSTSAGTGASSALASGGYTWPSYGSLGKFEPNVTFAPETGSGSGGVATLAEGMPENANWAQSSYNAAGEFSARGQSELSKITGMQITKISDLTDAINAGLVDPSVVPVQYAILAGQPVILNTRSAVALTNAEIPRSAWNAVNVSSDSGAISRLINQLSNNALPNPNLGTPIMPTQGIK